MGSCRRIRNDKETTFQAISKEKIPKARVAKTTMPTREHVGTSCGEKKKVGMIGPLNRLGKRSII